MFEGNWIVVYHSPSQSDAEFIRYFQEWCENNLNYEETNIITGDFNLDLLSGSFYSDKIMNVIRALGLKQLVKSPTRIVERSRTLIDYVISNQYKLKVNVLLDEKISDHSTIEIDLNRLFKSEKKVEYKTKIVNYSREKFTENLLNVNWSQSYRMNINDKANFIVNNMKDCLSEFIRTVKVNDNNKVWYNREIRNLRMERDRAYSRAFHTDMVSDWIYYEQKNDEYIFTRKNAKDSYYETKLINAYGDQKETWRILKEIIQGVKDENKLEIKFDDVYIKEPNLIASKFNEFYINSIDDIIESIPNESEFDLNNWKEVKNDFDFAYADYDSVIRILKGIKSKGDCEHINKEILMDALEVIGLPMLGVINSSLEELMVPNEWKNSFVTPIPKKPGTSRAEEFRPVNQLPTYEKLLEGIVKEQLNEHMDKNEIIIDEQFGFRKGHDCEAALDFLIMQWKKEIENNKIVIAVFIDLKRAFETVDRNILLQKLEMYGIRGETKKWFESYLDNRTQQTKYGGVTSSKILTKYGVPQGSKLSSDLFILYINNINTCLEHSKIVLFADDTTIYLTCDDVYSGVKRMNEDMKRLNKWLNCNKMKLNVEKSKCMVMNGSDDILNCEPIMINGEIIERVDQFKLLGVNVKNDLKMNDHCEYIVKKVAKKTGFLARISRKLTLQSRIMIYKTIISPHFEYCPSLLFTCNKGEMHKMQLQQNKAMRIILRCSKITSIELMLDTLCLMSVRQRIYYLTFIRIFKLKNGQMPKKLNEMAKLVGDTKKYWLRNEADFRIITVKKSSTQNSMMQEGLVLFNKLPNDLKLESDILKFKNKLKDYVKSNVSVE